MYRRLFDVLSGADSSTKFAKLSDDDRRNVLAILRDSKPACLTEELKRQLLHRSK